MSLKTQKTCHLVAAKAANGKPTDAQLEKINQYTLTDLTADDVYVRTFYLAHNGIDRDKEVFEDALLRDFAKTLPGKGLFVRHPGSWDGDSGPGEGRWFEAKLVTLSLDEARDVLREPKLVFAPETEKAKLLEVSAYMVRTDENATLLKKIDGGVAGDVSIGFAAADREPIRDDDDNIIAWRWKAPGEGLEGSLVWLGAQPGARAFKNADFKTTGTNDEGDAMNIKELTNELTKALSDNAGLATQVKELTDMAARYEVIEGVLGKETATSAEKVTQLLSDAKAGRAAHEALVKELVGLERKAELIGDSEQDSKDATDLYADMPTAKLVKLVEKHKAQAGDSGQQIAGGNPNTNNTSSDDGSKAKDAVAMSTKDLSSPQNNPLFAA